MWETSVIKLISDTEDSIFDEKEKYRHIKVLRSQLSDYEQMLLFYNSLSDFGTAWNKRKDKIYKEQDMGFIARFRLIKNIPGNIIWRGIIPFDYYKEEKQWWEQKNSNFTEIGQFLQAVHS